jgi:hypothetical protein
VPHCGFQPIQRSGGIAPLRVDHGVEHRRGVA